MLKVAGSLTAALALLVVCAPAAARDATGAGDSAIGSTIGPTIGFDTSMLDSAGLYGPADGLRALDYEFCIPERAHAITRVRAIDPSVRMYRSPGRIGCPRNQLLVIGNTHQDGYREVLEALARLEFVTRIEQAHFE